MLIFLNADALTTCIKSIKYKYKLHVYDEFKWIQKWNKIKVNVWFLHIYCAREKGNQRWTICIFSSIWSSDKKKLRAKKQVYWRV